jgi:nucleoside-triphosphatase THEP1
MKFEIRNPKSENGFRISNFGFEEHVMPDQPADVAARLHAIARMLRDVQHLEPEAQRALAELVDELGHSLEPGRAPPEEVQQLTESTAHLVEALHRQSEGGLLASARDRLEEAALEVETKHPVIAGMTLRLVETLRNLGI